MDEESIDEATARVRARLDERVPSADVLAPPSPDVQLPMTKGEAWYGLKQEGREVGRRAKVAAFWTAHKLPILAAALVIAGFAGWFFQQQSATIESQPTQERAVVEDIVSDRRLLYEELGPMNQSVIVDGAELPATENHLVWMKVDGVIETSSRSFSSRDVVWSSIRPSFVEALSIDDGTASFDWKNQTYYVHVGQPFVHEEFPEVVYRVDGTGTFLQADAADVVTVLSN